MKYLVRTVCALAILALGMAAVFKGDDWLRERAKNDTYAATAAKLGVATEQGRREWVLINRLADADIEWTDARLLQAFTAPDRVEGCDRVEVMRHAMILGASYADAQPKMIPAVRDAIGRLAAESFGSGDAPTAANAVWAARALGWNARDVKAATIPGSMADHVADEWITGKPMAERGDE